VTPTLGSAIRMAAAAFRREAWLAALGLLVTGARRATSWPAVWAAWGLALRAAVAAYVQHPLQLSAPLEGALAMATSSRFLGLVGGLWLAGAAISGALRVAWASGALPVLGAAMVGEPRGARGFADGVADGFARVLPAAVLGFVLELSGALFALALALAAAVLAGRGQGWGVVLGLSAAVAVALTLALAVPMALSTAADALVARSALVQEPLADTLAGVTRRFLSRPGGFLLGALLFGGLGVVAQVGLQAAGGLATGFAGPARAAPGLVVLGPRLMLGALSALVAGVVDLLWLSTLAVMSCGQLAPGDRPHLDSQRRTEILRSLTLTRW
jgi:hypothetical protein